MSLTSPSSLTATELIDPKTVAMALEHLYRDPELLQKRSLTAYRHATDPRYSWDTVAESFDEILTELTQGPETSRLSPPHEQATALAGTHDS